MQRMSTARGLATGRQAQARIASTAHSAAFGVARPLARIAGHHAAFSQMVTKVAAIEEQQTAYEPAAAYAEVKRAVPDVDAQEIEDLQTEELDAAQEQLLKWMMFKDEDEQEEDLDEMVDYDQYGDEEYEELYDELEQLYEDSSYQFKVGDKVMGTVVEIDDDGAYVDIGAKSSAFCPVNQCSFAKLKTPLEVLRVGMKREFLVIREEDEFGTVGISLAAIEAGIFWQRIRQMQEEDITVNVLVESGNKGGLLVTYANAITDGFVPVSQYGPSINPETQDELIGSYIPCKFLEVDEENARLVFSNKRASSSSMDLPGLKVGDVVEGVVQSVKPYGAFIDLGGVTGLLHVSQISHDRVMSVDKILSVDDKLKVMILSQDRERGRVTLSTKKLEPTPGDMLRDPQLVFEKAEEMAQVFKDRVANAQAGWVEGAPIDGVGFTSEMGYDPNQQYDANSGLAATGQEPYAF